MKKLKVFMIMPFQEQFLMLYNMIKSRLESKFEFSNAGDLDNQQNILQDIVIGISNADVVIADLTGLNPNVFYELGLCHALNKKVIIITQDMSELPFDIKSYRANAYTTDFWKINEIIDKIEKNLLGAEDGSVQFGNPINDYCPIIIESKISQELAKEDENIEEGEKGFVDFIADIDEDTNKLTAELVSMKDGLNEMNVKIEYSTTEINRVSKKQSSGNASFIRNITKKVGVAIQEFADKMKVHNDVIENTWERIENNFLDLIDNKYMENESNKEGLIASLKSLHSMKNSIYVSNLQVESMISAFGNLKGVERKLTQAIISIEEQMGLYLDIMESADSSIDRIISKAGLLVGKIEFNAEIE